MESKARNRVALFALGVIVLCAAIGARLLQLQVFRSDELEAQARRQHQQMIEIGGERGAILDRNGRDLAISVATSSLFAHPPRVQDPARAARALSAAIDVPESKILEKLRSDSPFVWLKRRLDPRAARAVEALPLPIGPGKPFGLESEAKRFYPQGSLAAQVVGFANIDQVGLEGIEQAFNETLRSDTTAYLAVRDGRGGMVLRLARPPSKLSEDVVVTLDLGLQHVVERELERTFVESGARAAAAILIDPATGQILALANRPTADPNRFGEATTEGKRNRAVVDMYEPGSTFKVVTAAAALDLGTVTPERPFDCQNGAIQVASARIRDHHPYGVLSVREILEKSSNVGIIKVGRTIPPARFDEYVRRFGFGKRTGLELPGEQRGMFTPLERWSALTPASMAMGQEIAVTALQTASAIATVANDGVRVPPRIVLGTRDAEGAFHPAPAPEPVRVISIETARTLRGILEGVVARGTGQRAAVPGYRIAGKTGTAQKVDPHGGYSHTQFMASFVGFGPADAPRIAGIVLLDSPSLGGYYGGQVAAPAFGRIFADALAYLRVAPDTCPPAAEEAPSPDRLVAEARSSKPAAGDAEEEAPRVPIATAPGQVPDVLELSLREAVAALAAHGYRARVEGQGTVLAQAPPPGTPLAPGRLCSLRLGARESAPPSEPETKPVLTASRDLRRRRGR